MIHELKSGLINARLSGKGERTVLLLHGWGGSMDSWKPVERDLSAGMRVLNVDFPGFGESPEPRDVWCVTQYAEQILELLDEMEISRVTVIAHSFGGRVALMLNQMRPELIDRQVLTGCAGLIGDRDAQKGGLAHKLSGLYDNGFTRRLLGDKGVERIRDTVRSHFGSEDYKNASPKMREVFKQVIHQDLAGCLPGIKASTLLIWGEADTATPLWMGRQMEKTIPDAGLVVFEGCGHFAYLQQYARFITIVKQFLNV